MFDITNKDVTPIYNDINYDVVIALEIFEHIDDTKAISYLKSGCDIIITVPNFDAPAHARHFKTGNEVILHYINYINIELLKTFDKYFILKGTIK